MGYASSCIKIGEKTIQYGKKYSQIRGVAMGHVLKSGGYVAFGDLNKATTEAEMALSHSEDTFYKFTFSNQLIVSSILANDLQRADELIQQILPFHIKNNNKWMGDMTVFLNGCVLVGKGSMSQGFEIIKKMEQAFIRQRRRGVLPWILIGIGRIYFEIIKQSKPISSLTMIKNIGFIVKNVPSTHKKAIYLVLKVY